MSKTVFQVGLKIFRGGFTPILTSLIKIRMLLAHRMIWPLRRHS